MPILRLIKFAESHLRMVSRRCVLLLEYVHYVFTTLFLRLSCSQIAGNSTRGFSDGNTFSSSMMNQVFFAISGGNKLFHRRCFRRLYVDPWTNQFVQIQLVVVDFLQQITGELQRVCVSYFLTPCTTFIFIHVTETVLSDSSARLVLYPQWRDKGLLRVLRTAVAVASLG